MSSSAITSSPTLRAPLSTDADDEPKRPLGRRLDSTQQDRGSSRTLAGAVELLDRVIRHVEALQTHGVARISRPFSGCVGRAFIGYICAKRATSALEMDVGVFSTNQVTFSLHGGVVREPVNV